MNTAPILTPRALQELLKGNHSNFVSIKVDNEIFLRLHRSVAMRFSPVWKHDLQNPLCGILTVAFPPDPPAAPLPNPSAPVPGNGPATPPTIPPPPPPSNKTALKFVVQWMEQGGAVPRGRNAVSYPKNYRAALVKLLAIAEMLQIGELASRLQRDLGQMPVARPRVCGTCKRIEHPGRGCETCWYCDEVGHRRAVCPKAREDYLERVARRERRAERERVRLERVEEGRRRWEEREERRVRREEREEREKIRTGQMGVGDNGKTILRWV